MPTLAQIRQRMLQLEPQLLGRVVTPSSFTATTVVSSELAVGTVTSGRFGGYWMLRPTSATSADRVRLVTPTGYAAATGTLTHAGANYADTVVGTEIVELHRYEPYLLDVEIQEAVRRCRFIDTQHFQARPDGRYDLAGFSWIDEPSLVARFGRRGIPTLTSNRHFDGWGTVHTDGTLRPDSWVLAGAGATFARSTTTRRGRYSLSVTRAGADATVSVTIPVLFSDAAGDNLRTKTVTGVIVARSANALSVRVRVTSEDGTGTVLSTTNSGYHAGDGKWQELSAVHTVHASAEQLTVSGRVEVNEAALLGELYGALVSAVTDDLRRDQLHTRWQDRPYDYQQYPLVWQGPSGIGEQIVMESKRAYPTFDATRLAAGNADSDSTDCPLDLAAHKALALFFEARKTENARMASLAEVYAQKADDLQKQHMLVPTQSQPGAPVVSGRSYGVRARVA